MIIDAHGHVEEHLMAACTPRLVEVLIRCCQKSYPYYIIALTLFSLRMLTVGITKRKAANAYVVV